MSTETLLGVEGQSAATITKALRCFGGGNMAKGLKRLYESGVSTGRCKGRTQYGLGCMALGAIITGTGITFYKYLKNIKAEELKVNQILRAAELAEKEEKKNELNLECKKV